ncbi:ABC transporter [Phlyctema vagabunda]|uniref:ABC transporter n=1 Tax=Phlyctema vagabunda TaxID=108571 RepID=A0ABR4PU50_9HELO
MLFGSSLVSAVGLAATVAAYARNVPVETRSLDEIYEAALTEDRNLVVVWGGDAGGQGNGVRNAWKARFPDITLDLTVDLSKYHDSRIDRAWYDKNETVDIATLQTLHDFKRWKEQDRLLYYKSPTFEDLYSGEKDLDGAFVPMGIYSFGSFFYDNTKVAAADVPVDYTELLDPKWKGKLVITYPNDDDAICYLFALIVERYGFEWLDALAAQDVQWVRGTATPSYVIVDQHNNATASSAGRVLTFSTSGYPGGSAPFLASRQPDAPEQVMAWAQTSAAFSSTKRPETAKLFLAWITSTEYQKPGAGYSPLKSFDAGKVMTSNVTQTSGFRQFMQDRTSVDWWKLQFETTLGTAQGPGPIDLYP